MDLMRHLPEHLYSGEAHVADLQGAFGAQAGAVAAARDDLLLQARPSTATWGLERYEREYGILPDRSKTPAQRLAFWRAKRRGQGTVTREYLRNVAAGYSGGLAEVEEFPAQHRFVIRFTGCLGVPPGIEDFKALVEELKPAHLAVEYQYTYNTHGDLAGRTHRFLGGYTHGQLRQTRLAEQED